MGMARPPRSGPASADRTAVARSGYRTRSGTLHTADEAESYSCLSVHTTHKTYFFVEHKIQDSAPYALSPLRYFLFTLV